MLENFSIVDINGAHNAAFELVLMKSCAHQILANSTLSCFAAYFNDNPKKLVISPDKFLVDYTWDIRPKEWAIIEHNLGEILRD